ncbi:MAG TPA: NADH:ubiquinone oxidoreductase subunit NDUFA12 [Dongiaceae bacterium]|jgi:NADH:ubiquinone oxidoreductase subunit|nr:NADH:ubiquinone oxidoreductase subunit NDUFA12 [Dongiaceae bacterium]
MSLGTIFYTLLFGELVGQDSTGNRYYRDKRTRGQKRERRWVMYKGVPEASKVPAEWHGWLHSTQKNPPAPRQPYPWEKPHLPNLTGTRLAYLPPGHPGRGKERKDMRDYQAWVP